MLSRILRRGAGVVEASRDGPGHAVPIALRRLSAERSAVASLSDDTVAQIVRVFHKARIQINERIPCGLHAAVILHMTHHEHECITRACPQARQWMADAAARRISLLSAASLPA